MYVRKWNRTLALAGIAAVLATACAEGRLEPRDQGEDEPRITDDDPPPVRVHAGGGEARSKNYQGRIQVGTPVPARRGESDNYRATITAGPAIEAAELQDDE